MVTKYDRQFYVPLVVRLHARDDTEEGQNGGADLGPRDAHGIDGLNI